MNTQKHLYIVGLLLVLALLAACAPTPTPAPTAAPPTASRPTEAPKPTVAPTTAPVATTAPTVAPTAAPKPTEATPNFAGKTLNVSFFAFNVDLINKNINQPFEKKYGAKIVYDTGNNADRLAKLIARKDNPNIDVVAFSTEFLLRAVQAGVIQPYDPAKLKNLDQLYDWAKDPLGNRMGVGYTISGYTLFYRSDKVKEPITSWKDLWRPELKGYISLPDITTTNGPATIVLIAKAYGGDLNNDQIAWDKLAELKPSLVTAYKNSAELITLVQQDEVWVSGYSKFAWGNLLNTKKPLQSVVPKEGIVGFINTLSVVKGTPNADLAHAYIDFMISQEVQLAEALDLVDSPANKNVKVPLDIGEKLTYGDDVIKSLIFLNDQQISDKRQSWIDRWNKLMAK
jgi:putative spermidine/putrescine transport system substrate-binding protein